MLVTVLGIFTIWYLMLHFAYSYSYSYIKLENFNLIKFEIENTLPISHKLEFY